LQDWSNKWLLKLNILKHKTVFFAQNMNKNYTYSVQGGLSRLYSADEEVISWLTSYG